jgi:hypothetical protein
MIIALKNNYFVRKEYDLIHGNLEQLLYYGTPVLERTSHHILTGECKNSSIAKWIARERLRAIKCVFNPLFEKIECEELDRKDTYWRYLVGQDYCGLYLCRLI